MYETPDIHLAKRMHALPPYLFGMIHDLKERKLNSGKDVIDLGMGNPTDPPPSAVIRKLCDCASTPRAHRYPGRRRHCVFTKTTFRNV